MLRIGRSALREEFAERETIRCDRKDLTHFSGESDDAIPPFGLAHDASQRRRAIREKIGGDGAVGRDHEVLDQVACLVPPRDLEIDHLSVHDDR
jgi:hypothetical protein